METRKIFIISAFAFICAIPATSQEKDRKVQMRILENGKVITDTTFAVNDKVGKEDIDRFSKMMNNREFFVFRERPTGKNFAYEFKFNGMPGKEIDSLMRNHFRLNHDSAFSAIPRHFDEGGFFDERFQDRPMPYRYFYYNPPHSRHRIIERDIFMDTPEKESVEEQDIIIERKSPGKKQIIIKNRPGEVKTIRKKIDDDTEIIIIKKDAKKIKPKKDISRKRER